VHKYIINVATQKKTNLQSTHLTKEKNTSTQNPYNIGEDRCYHKKGYSYIWFRKNKPIHNLRDDSDNA